MAPEQASGDVARIDERADVWGLGAILHFLLYDREPGGEMQRRQIPRPLRAILQRALEPQPERRYLRVADLNADINAFLAGAAVSAYRENIAERVLRVALKYRVFIAIVLAYLLMRVLLVAFTGR
jgi:hypothetical protein